MTHSFDRENDRVVSERYFNGLPVIEARESVRLYVKQEDIDKAVPLDPGHCPLAESARRLYDSTCVVFLRTVAYLDMPDENNQRVVYRYALRGAASDFVRNYDPTGLAHPGSLVLHAMPRSLELGIKRNKTHTPRNTKPTKTKRQYLNIKEPVSTSRAPLIKGERGDGIKGGRIARVAIVEDVRYGTGLVTFR